MGKHTNGLWQGKFCVTMNVCRFQRAHPAEKHLEGNHAHRSGRSCPQGGPGPGKGQEEDYGKRREGIQGKRLHRGIQEIHHQRECAGHGSGREMPSLHFASGGEPCGLRKAEEEGLAWGLRQPWPWRCAAAAAAERGLRVPYR